MLQAAVYKDKQNPILIQDYKWNSSIKSKSLYPSPDVRGLDKNIRCLLHKTLNINICLSAFDFLPDFGLAENSIAKIKSKTTIKANEDLFDWG